MSYTTQTAKETRDQASNMLYVINSTKQRAERAVCNWTGEDLLSYIAQTNDIMNQGHDDLDDLVFNMDGIGEDDVVEMIELLEETRKCKERDRLIEELTNMNIMDIFGDAYNACKKLIARTFKSLVVKHLTDFEGQDNCHFYVHDCQYEDRELLDLDNIDFYFEKTYGVN